MDLHSKLRPPRRRGPAHGASRSPDPAAAGKERRSRPARGLLWRGAKYVLTAPVAAFPAGRIVRGGRLIGGLVSDLRRGPPPPRVVPRQRDGELDKAATAFDLGLTEGQFEDLLARRRRRTAGLAYAAFAMGWMCIFAWLMRVLGQEWTAQRAWTAVQFAPFCLVFLLAAFQQAHANWQIRTGRLGSAGDYLRSPEPFWPRP